MLLARPPRYSPEGFHVRLACLIHAANVRSEPGSNPSLYVCSKYRCIAAGHSSQGSIWLSVAKPQRTANSPKVVNCLLRSAYLPTTHITNDRSRCEAVANRPHQKAHTLLLSRPPKMPKIEPSTALSSLRGAREGSEQPLPVKPACRFFCAARQLGMPAQRSHGELPPPAQLHHARDRPAQRTVSVGQGAGVNGNLIAKLPRAKTTPPASPNGLRRRGRPHAATTLRPLHRGRW